MSAARERILRKEVTEALVRLSAGTPQTREEIFNGRVDANKAAWQRKILERLETAGYIQRVDMFGSARFAKYATVGGTSLKDFLENPKALTGLIWPGQATAPMPTPETSAPEPESPPVETAPALTLKEEAATPAVADQSMPEPADEDIPDPQLKAAILKVMYGLTQEVGRLAKAVEQQNIIVEKLAAELGVK